jgi:hypothetical protein
MLSSIRIFVGLAAISLGSAVHGQEVPLAPVQYIDHIMIRTDNPEELFALFSRTLQLPIAWPLADRGGVVSGGAGFGNVTIEAIRFPGQINDPAPTHLVGLALKPPALDLSLRELDRRGIAYGAPRPFVSVGPDGVRTTSFTNVTLQHLSDADQPSAATIQVFLSEYNPVYVDAAARRARLRVELIAKRGGPLGLVRVQEVIIGAVDLTGASRAWHSLVSPAPPSGVNLWQIGDGPAVRLVHSERNLIQGLVLVVTDLAAARNFLERNELLGTSSDTEIVIAPSKIRGLNIRLISERSAVP